MDDKKFIELHEKKSQNYIIKETKNYDNIKIKNFKMFVLIDSEKVRKPFAKLLVFRGESNSEY